jgi:hypothetical protein
MRWIRLVRGRQELILRARRRVRWPPNLLETSGTARATPTTGPANPPVDGGSRADTRPSYNAIPANRSSPHHLAPECRQTWKLCGSLSRHDRTRKRPQSEARDADLAPDPRKRPASARIGSLLIRKRSLVRVQDRPVARANGSGAGEQRERDAGAKAVEGAAAVAFECELAGPRCQLDPAADRAERSVAAGFVFASGRRNRAPRLAMSCSNPRCPRRLTRARRSVSPRTTSTVASVPAGWWEQCEAPE